jgi:hypothetical protein
MKPAGLGGSGSCCFMAIPFVWCGPRRLNGKNGDPVEADRHIWKAAGFLNVKPARSREFASRR